MDEAEREKEAIDELTTQLCAFVEKAPTHRLALIALASTYQAVAVTHPCCTRAAADVALSVGATLLSRSLTAPAGTHIH